MGKHSSYQTPRFHTKIIRPPYVSVKNRGNFRQGEGVSRDDNLYAYVRTDDAIIDITDGTHVPLGEFVAASSGRILELDIDPQRCFVSDLGTYDTLKAAIDSHENQSVFDRLAKSYWDKVVKLSSFDPAVIRRPEIMITYDVPPNNIRPA